MATTPSGIKLPEGTEILERGGPTEKAVDVALEIAALGASVAMVRAVGGEEAVTALHANGDAS